MFARPERGPTVFLEGGPGVGKTTAPRIAAEKHDLDVIVFPLASCDEVDLRGLPRIIRGKTIWASPLPRTGRGVLVLDELSSASKAVQTAAHHLIYSEPGSDMFLPKGWHIVATGNRSIDRAVHHPMAAPLRNRMMQFKVEADFTEWIKWAESKDINPMICGFLRWRPELLVERTIPVEGAFATPRSWEMTSDHLKLNLQVSAEQEQEQISGIVGEGVATEFSAFLLNARGLPSYEAIEKDPEHIDIPISPATLYAITSMLAHQCRSQKTSLMKYVRRLPAEFALLYILQIRDFYDIGADRGCRAWIGEHKALFQGAA